MCWRKVNWGSIWHLLIYSRHCFANKVLSGQGYGFSRGHVWMWELDCEESWVPKNGCFWTMVLEKTLESPLDCRDIQPVHPKDQSWVFIGRTDAEAETPILWPPDVNSWLFVTPWIAAHQASLSITNSRSLLKLMSFELVMPSSHLILPSPSPLAPNPS